MPRFRIDAAIFMLITTISFSSFAIVGFGVHWGNDFTLQMDDKINEQLIFDNITIDIDSIDNSPDGITIPEISGKYLPLYISRTDWQRKMLNIGGKFYVDILPVIDALELSANFGVWEYKGEIKYPISLEFKNRDSINTVNPNSPDDLFNITYATMPITLDEFDMGYLGLHETPYMKLNFDLTIRKYIVQFPKRMKTLRIYGGGGASLIFATPILSSSLIQDALGKQLSSIDSPDELQSLLSNEKIMKAVVEEIGAQLMTPHWGCHLDLGIMLKIPALPIGFYVDGKLMIPFEKMDKSVDIGGTGFVLNSGISLTF